MSIEKSVLLKSVPEIHRNRIEPFLEKKTYNHLKIYWYLAKPACIDNLPYNPSSPIEETYDLSDLGIDIESAINKLQDILKDPLYLSSSIGKDEDSKWLDVLYRSNPTIEAINRFKEKSEIFHIENLIADKINKEAAIIKQEEDRQRLMKQLAEIEQKLMEK